MQYAWPQFGSSRWFRVKVDENTVSIFINGEHVQTRELPADRQPWFGFRTWWQSKTTLRDVHISGNPQIPQEVALTESGDLHGWLNYQYGNWSQIGSGDEIQLRGYPQKQFSGCGCESLIRSFRPLTDGDSVEYEFFYTPDLKIVHPVVDREAFIVNAEGVTLRRITTGRHQAATRTSTPAVAVESDLKPARTLGIPKLIANHWNRGRLSLEGGVITVEINDEPVASHKLSKINDRVFGFHYDPGSEAAQIRNVVMRGDWPEKLPSHSGQKLADSIVEELNRAEAAMPDSVTHSFRNGVPKEFQTINDPGGIMRPLPNGVYLSRSRNTGWGTTRFALPFQVRGDFDIEAGFTGANLRHETYSAYLLDVHLADSKRSWVRTMRRTETFLGQTMESSIPQLTRGGGRDYSQRKQRPCTSPDGRLRIVRRNSKMYYLFAEGDSRDFHVFNTTDAPLEPSLPGEIILELMSQGSGQSAVIATDFRISADEIHYQATGGRPPVYIHIMNADGTDDRRITQAIEQTGSPGSPDWSPDGTQIAFDVYTGEAGTTKVFLVNADGTNQRPVSFGAMPNFSPNGKQFVCTRLNRQFAIVNTDGSDAESITPTGWGAQWSPDGQWIAFDSREVVNGVRSRNIVAYNISTKEKRVLLQGRDATRYSFIYWNMEWAPDSKRICFKGTAEVTPHMAIAYLDGSPVDVLLANDILTEFAWHPDGQLILFSAEPGKMADITKPNSDVRGGGMFLYDMQKRRVRSLPQPINTQNQSGCWSPDGKKIAYTSQGFEGAVRWNGRRHFTSGDH